MTFFFLASMANRRYPLSKSPSQSNTNKSKPPKIPNQKKENRKRRYSKTTIFLSLSLSLSLSLLSLHASTFVNLLAFSHGNHSLPSLSIPSLQPQTFISKDPSVLSPSQIKLSFSHQTYYF